MFYDTDIDIFFKTISKVLTIQNRFNEYFNNGIRALPSPTKFKRRLYANNSRKD